MGRVAVVIPHGYEQRRYNIPKIIDGFNGGSLVPDSITIVYNSLKYIYLADNVKSVTCTENYGSSVRYAVGLVTDAEYLIFQDDDLLLGEHDVCDIVHFLSKNPDAIVGFAGNVLGEMPNPYLKRKHFNLSRKNCEPKKVDIVLGRVTAMKRHTLTKAFPMMANIGFYGTWTHEDIPICLANRENNFLLPLNVTELPTNGVALEKKREHYPLRNEITRKCLEYLTKSRPKR